VLELSDDPLVVSSPMPVLPVELLPPASVVLASPVLVSSSGSASLVLTISWPVELSSSGSPVLGLGRIRERRRGRRGRLSRRRQWADR
jgi:hypothetical protein